ncbi:MAG: HAD-IIIA family hydrolase [Lachnospiraceae bacterium]|nr:HAD-IIIA family hydrolase [Lachnospiraceae bacterium]
MKYNTVIFDLDGTLLDTLEDLTDSVNFALSAMKYANRTLKEVRSFVGNGVRKLIERSVPTGTPVEDIDKTFNYFLEYYNLHNQDKTKPYEGVIDLMYSLKSKGIKMAIVSNKVHDAVLMLQEKFFSEVVEIAIGDMPDMERKPAPDSCFKALELLGSTVEEACYVGDSEVDLATAQNAGLDCISVLWGFRDKELLVSQGAKIFARTPDEVLKEVIG